MFVVVILSIIDINYVSQTQSEMNDSAKISMRNVLKGKRISPIYPMTKNDMEVELIRNIATNINVENELIVNVLELNENGLIDLSLKSNFAHTNGVKDSRFTRHTMIVEQYPKR